MSKTKSWKRLFNILFGMSNAWRSSKAIASAIPLTGVNFLRILWELYVQKAPRHFPRASKRSSIGSNSSRVSFATFEERLFPTIFHRRNNVVSKPSIVLSVRN